MAASRPHDLVVLGATGFTGNRICKEVLNSGFSGKWAVAGRDRVKLERLAASLAGNDGNEPSIVVADVADPASLLEMAKSCRVLITTVGPFRHWGEPVVKACVEAGTDYLDVCGEPEFIERVELLYNETAKQAGCYLASAVGFDSVPGDLGVAYTMSLFKPPARCTVVETALTIRGGPSGFKGHYPTYESAVHGFASAGELRKLRKEAEQARADASVVRRSMQRLVEAGQPAANVSVVFTLPSRYYLTLWQGFGSMFQFLAGKPWGRSLLLQYPRLFTYGMFSHEGPSERQLSEASFQFTNIAKGYSKGAPEAPDQAPDIEIVTRVSGPEPGYISCAIFVVQAAITLLEERQSLGLPGVHTPASLLRDTTYIDRLRSRGIKFEQVQDATVQ
ncbi:hypothetical protein CHLNCDRAFT_59409 [Chlorella variabilis]|uniref:Saccharopine dehydrogenase NADP binding domain-containing protein n=1 Tax=Chlorella variabilis TaxID=554065 RepID=E1ZTL1_CHLVA|nr:hypothetical protein CHLNCDRAFT_59409 [Chlorella variabilis]EFN50859.1 hypothetical protein CHLNCDRAFT_59409 [Chlorella variabilis]|eukprot:XP_005842961.1 hypothetical protein CHLNCDRAFT_59409 [Chlorella variabilis]